MVASGGIVCRHLVNVRCACDDLARRQRVFAQEHLHSLLVDVTRQCRNNPQQKCKNQKNAADF